MTKPLNLAESYMDSFFGQAPLEKMRTLFADDLVFEGPFYKSYTADEYMDSLLKDPPMDVHYTLEKTFEDDNSACMIYMFRNPELETRMVQTFEISDGKICKITLVFDSNTFS